MALLRGWNNLDSLGKLAPVGVLTRKPTLLLSGGNSQGLDKTTSTSLSDKYLVTNFLSDIPFKDNSRSLSL